ncbi:helix-turn-helix domain-containing protein [Thermosulfurimonas marina]|uniref:Helix-turn-helix domain-containing protein n=1 Tax=Thermosulfurimonas marina TaxID=2047767 RepID=A0A6H1WTM8_9BACT|nr:helix-turn-helix domain-containing protein [Thermosulfurimonas marina]QJA06504.1 helix-turn-helix domain-containing protein [Thermosulfurimonas marina]
MKAEIGLGEYLRKMREAQGKTLAEIAEETKINCRYLEALEKEAWEELPAEVFVRGYLRAYALALGLDPEDVLRRYRESRPQGGEDPGESLSGGKKSRGLWPWVLLLLVLVSLVLLWLLR